MALEFTKHHTRCNISKAIFLFFLKMVSLFSFPLSLPDSRSWRTNYLCVQSDRELFSKISFHLHLHLGFPTSRSTWLDAPH